MSCVKKNFVSLKKLLGTEAIFRHGRKQEAQAFLGLSFKYNSIPKTTAKIIQIGKMPTLLQNTIVV